MTACPSTKPRPLPSPCRFDIPVCSPAGPRAIAGAVGLQRRSTDSVQLQKDQQRFNRRIIVLPSDRRSRTGSSLQTSGFEPADPTVSSPG